jgi:phage terminase large subunit GpA-like protein
MNLNSYQGMEKQNPPATRQHVQKGVLTLTDRERQALAPPPDLTVSQWADKHRVLLPKTSREPGPWRTARTPYLRAVMDAYNLPYVRHIACCFGTQLGKSEGPILNVLGFIISEDPYSSILLYPSSDDARSVSRNRIQPMIDASPVLRAKKPLNEDSYQLGEMSFPGMALYCVGSNSPTPLSQRPCRNVLRDEIDKYPPVAGRDADPLSLSEERAKAFWDIRKVVDVSSPTVEEGNIMRQIRGCDTVYFYHIPCPSCRGLQRLDFRNIHFENNRELSRSARIRLAKKTAVYVCEHCGAEIQDKDREWFLSEENGARWVSDDAEAPEKPESVGFILSSLYSPWLTWGDCVAKFLEANLSGDPQKLMNFRNAWLAEPWVDRVEPKETEEILSHRTELPPLVVPGEAIGLTAGIDTGQGGFWYVVRAWARDLTSWLVDYGFLLSWDDVRALVFENVYEVEGSQGRSFLRIFRAGLDIGGTVTEEGISATEAAYAFLRAHGQRVIFGVKGMARPMGKRLRLSIIDTMPGRSGAPIPGGLVLWNIDTGMMKDLIHWRLQVKPGDPQAFYLHSETGEDYAKHLTAEEKRRNRRGAFEWVQIHRDNHLFDCEVYAAAMADAECWGGVAVLRGGGQKGRGQDAGRSIQRQERRGSSWLKPGRGSWLRG